LNRRRGSKPGDVSVDQCAKIAQIRTDNIAVDQCAAERPQKHGGGALLIPSDHPVASGTGACRTRAGDAA
jgi:hypothetical protein